MQPLTGMTVLDLTWHVAGPYATKMLADYGAEVLKVERPLTGDPARTYGPFPGDIPHLERSGTFLHLNTNKRSITADLKSETGKRMVRELARDADVLVESFSPHVMASLGLDYPALARVNPQIVMCSLSNFGQAGPYRDWKATDMTINALSGLMLTTGVADKPPLKAADHLMAYQAGSLAATAVMGAVLHSRWAGEGQHIDIAVYEVAAGSSDRRATAIVSYEYSGEPLARQDRTGSALPAGTFPCADGYASFMISPPARWVRFAQMVDRPDLLDDPRFQDPTSFRTPEVKEEFDGIFYPWLLDRTKKEVSETAQHHRLAVTPVNDTVDVLNDEHLNYRGFFVDGEHPEAGRLPHCGPAIFLDGQGFSLRSTAPLLGQHNGEVYRGLLGFSSSELDSLRDQGAV